MSSDGQAAEWRDAAAYAPLLAADPSLHAWEWLRRNPSYRSSARSAVDRPGGARGCRSQEAEHWGLLAFEDPDLAVPYARPMWSADIHPLVLCSLASAASGAPDPFELSRIAANSLLIHGERREHLLISDGLRMIRLDVVAGTLTRGPVLLRHLLSGLATAERPLLTLRRLVAYCGNGRFSRSLHPLSARARRWILALRANDALAAGAGQREIAEVLLQAGAGRPRWRSEAPSLRSQAQRLVRTARTMAAGYRSLLL